MQNPVVSIIIPLYNKEKYISDTLNSLLAQTYNNWEAIIVDDGSQDNSPNIVNKFCQQDQRFIFLKRDREPKGGSVCRNIGVEHSRGKYIIFLDADDVLSPDSLHNRIDKMNGTDNDFLVFTGGTFINKIGDYDMEWTPPVKADYLKSFLSHNLPWNISMPIWKASFLKKLNGFDEKYPRLQDVELHTKALMQENISFKIIGGEPDFFYRINEDRKVVSNYEFLNNFVNAVIIYKEKMSSKLKEHSKDRKYSRYLKGTYQSAFITVQTQYDQQNITKTERDNLFEKIKNNIDSNLLFKIYLLGLRFKLHKIKGYNFAFRLLIINF